MYITDSCTYTDYTDYRGWLANETLESPASSLSFTIKGFAV